jgi:hypothetical protein
MITSSFTIDMLSNTFFFWGATGVLRSMLRDDTDVGKDNGYIRRDVKKEK